MRISADLILLQKYISSYGISRDFFIHLSIFVGFLLFQLNT